MVSSCIINDLINMLHNSNPRKEMRRSLSRSKISMFSPCHRWIIWLIRRLRRSCARCDSPGGFWKVYGSFVNKNGNVHTICILYTYIYYIYIYES